MGFVKTDRLWWNCRTLLVLGMIVRCQALEKLTKVDIMSSKFASDNTIITCSISTSSSDDVREHYVYLHCPLLGNDKICYINCESLLVTANGTPVFTNAFSSCEKTWQLRHRVEFQYVVNRRFLDQGPWYCTYKNQKSTSITFQKYKELPISQISTSTSPRTSPRLSSCSQSTFCPAQSDNTSLIAGTICALCVSAICNVLLVISFCIFKYENRKYKRRLNSKESTTYPTEVLSMLSKNSNRQTGLNASSCSRTPSLDSRSNKESLSAYIQDTLHSNSFHTPSYYIHPDYRIVNIIPQSNNNRFNIEGPKLLLRHNSDDVNAAGHAFTPATHKNKCKPQRRSSQLIYNDQSPQSPHSQQIPFLVGRSYNSHQQLLNDSNDESGIGSESLCNYNIQKPTYSMGGSDTVDLIHQCDYNVIFAKPSMDTSS